MQVTVLPIDGDPSSSAEHTRRFDGHLRVDYTTIGRLRRKVRGTAMSGGFPLTVYRHLRVDYTTIGGLRGKVAEKWGVPPERQRYYGVSEHNPNTGAYRFNTEEIFGGKSGGDNAVLCFVLSDLARGRRIKYSNTIGVVLLPAQNDDNDGNSSQVVWEADTVAGRATAVEGTTRAKRARREGSAAGEGVEAGQDGGEDTERDENGLAAAGADAEEADEPAAEEAEGGNSDDEVAAAGAAARGAAVGGHNAAVEAEAAPPADDPMVSSPLRLWLRSLEVEGIAPHRFERYAPAFEREFASVDHLAVMTEEAAAAADGGDDDEVWRDVFRVCGVTAFGDKFWLRRAVAKRLAAARRADAWLVSALSLK